MGHTSSQGAKAEWQRLEEGRWTDELENTSVCVYMLLAGRAIKYKNQFCRITLC